MRVDVSTIAATPGIRDGNAYGYRVMIDNFLGLLPQFGVKFADDARVALHMREPKYFEPTPGKRNVLFTMWESQVLDPVRTQNLRRADRIITCSEFSRAILAKYSGKPVEVVPLGVRTDLFTYRKRKFSLPFRFLWLGAPNPRKGWDVLGAAFNGYFLGNPRVELYMKTTGVRRGMVDYQSNVIFDYRDLPLEEIIKLYHSAHAFVLPTAGEGFGLSAAEAMATGLPCIVTRYSGVLDFTDAKSVYYLDYSMRPTGTQDGDGFVAAVASPKQVAHRMRDIFADYSKAIRVGKNAHRKIQSFTWPSAARRLAKVLAN